MAFERNNTANDFETMLKRHLAVSNRSDVPCADFDAEQANAYLEGVLEGAPRSRYESHLSACSDCRLAIVTLHRLSPAVTPVIADGLSRQPVYEWWQRLLEGLRAPGWRYGLVGVATVLVAFGTFYAVNRSSEISGARSSVASIPPSTEVEAVSAANQAAPNTLIAPPSATPESGLRADLRANQTGQPARARIDSSSGVLVGSGSQSASGLIAGKVSSMGGLAVAEADVVLVDSVSQRTQATTRTDALGQFKLPAVPEGNYHLKVQAEGYAPQQISEVRPLIAQDLQVKLDMGPAERQAIASLQQRTIAGETEEKKELARQAMIALQRQDAQQRPEAAPPSQTSQTGAARGASSASEASGPLPDAGARRLTPREAKSAKPQPTPVRSNEDENFQALIRKVRDKSFRFDRGVWIDQDYKPENRMPRTRLTRDTPEFEKALADIPSLAPFFDLGKVIVVWQGRVYEVRK